MSAPVAQDVELLDARTERHLRGACLHDWGWLLVWLAAYGGIICYYISQVPPTKATSITLVVCGSVVSGVVVPGATYWFVGRPRGVAIGLLVDFFWCGGILGGWFAGELNDAIGNIFQEMFPDCNLEDQAKYDDDSVSCQAGLLLQWILTPGLWEELFKAVWVLLRVRTKPWWGSFEGMAVPRRTGCFPTTCCTAWYRLASTPEGVFLCAMAAGAGFEALENVDYVVMPAVRTLRRKTNEELLQSTALRATFFVHILWTGYVGLRLAQLYFAEQPPRPFLLSVLPVIVLHGLWDYLATDMERRDPFLPDGFHDLAFFLIFAISVALCFGPVYAGALRSGLRGSVVSVEGSEGLELRGREVQPAA